MRVIKNKGALLKDEFVFMIDIFNFKPDIMPNIILKKLYSCLSNLFSKLKLTKFG